MSGLQRSLQRSWRLRSRAWVIMAVYALGATLWIYFSDQALMALAPDTQTFTRWSVYKGGVFVAITSVLLLLLIWRIYGAIEKAYAALKSQSAEIKRLNRLYAALSNINQAIVRTRSHDELFERVCRGLVELGGLDMAWIGWHDPDSQRLVPVATHGRHEDFARNITIRLDDLNEMVRSTGRTLVEGQPYVCNDMAADPDANPWRREAMRCGFRASAVFPIRVREQMLGTLIVYADTAGFFNDKEIALLVGAAGDLAFALEGLEQERERRRAEATLRELNETLEYKVAERTRELEATATRAEAADRLKSAFLATMSHELRTPLNSIIGFTGIVLQGLAGPLTPEQTKQLGMVRSSARHLLDLINDVLDLSKIEAGQLQVKPETFDLPTSIERVVASIGLMVEKKNLELHADVASELGSMHSDRRRVEQIMLNLLNNAVKFTDRGSVTLRADRLPDFRPAPDASPVAALRIRVRDTGIGIKPEDLKGLFQPFSQIDTGLTRQHEGTGLGLAICRRLATLLGGTIAADSVWSEGSEFTVVLPLELS